MARSAAARRRIERIAVPFAVIGITVTALAAGPSGIAVADDYPGEDQIAAAREAANGAAASVNSLDAAIASLESALQDAEVAALSAGEDYHVAADEAEAAQAELASAEQRADEAEQALALARRGLAGAAMQSYKNAGSMGSLEAITQAEGFDQVIQRSEAVSRASAEADVTVQEVSAAELVATTTRAYAEEAAVKAQEAEQAAQGALDAAESARVAADQAVADAEVARSAAVTRLAELRGVTEDLERERQDGLAAERAARERAAFEAEQTRLEAERDAEEVSNPVGGSGSSSGSGSTSTPKPTATSTSKPTSSPKPTETSAPDPTETSEPEPTKTSEPEPTKTSEPEPTKTSKPEPTKEPDPEPEPSWSSSAAQGRAATAHALSLQGHPYSQTLDGGTGPTYYDCSGLTQEAWSVAGKYIPRTSRTQYAATTHLPYSELRPGDLVFLSSNGTTAGIYHVSMYIGNGMVMEARKPGVLSQTRSLYAWGVSDMMPYIGRP